MKKKNNTRKLLIIVIVVLSVLLAALLGLAFVLIRGGAEVPETEPSTEQTQAETNQPTEEQPQMTEEPAVPETTEPEDLTVSTKFGDHRYPGIWEDQVRTEVVEEAIGGRVIYYGKVNGKESPLFTVYYGKGSANSQTIGTMKVDGLSLAVSIELNDFQPDETWSQEEIDTFCAMQEGMNDVIEHMKKDPAFSAALGTVPTDPTETTEPAQDGEDPTEAETTEPPAAEDMVISTPCGDLYYPGRWGEQVRSEVKKHGFGCTVTFYGTVAGRELKLFTVFFAADSENSFPVGVITVDDISMDVSMELYELEMDSSWNQEQMDTISAMQEAVNYLIEKLQENPAFIPA